MPSITPLRSGDPTRLGDHDLRGRLGEGGQGVVYLGIDPSGTQVAVKWLRPELSGDPVMVERFLREVSVAERVAPFCTAQVLGRGVENDRPFIVSEYIDGPSLQAVVAESGPRTGPALHRLAIGTATALAAIHQAGIVHRDFKPANVLVASDGPRVIDFGIARALDATATLSSTVVGTPAYMAPEQIEGQSVGPAADLFSWGSTMVYAASGTPPFGTDTLHAVINRVLTLDPDLSCLEGPLRDLVAACLSKDPTQRPPAEQIILRLLSHPVAPAGNPAILQEAAAAAAEQSPPHGPPSHPQGPQPQGQGPQQQTPYPGHPHPQGPPSHPQGPHSQPGQQGVPSGQPSYPGAPVAAFHQPPGGQSPAWGPGGNTPPPAPTAVLGQSPGQHGPPFGQPQAAHYSGPPSGPPYGQQSYPQPGQYPQPGYGGGYPQHGPPTQPQSGSRRGGLIAGVIGGVLAVALVTTVAIVLLNNREIGGGPGPTTSAALTTPPPETPTPPPTPTPPVPTDGLQRVTLPGNSRVTLFEHPSDAINLTSYQIQDTSTKEWVDYARDSLTGDYSKYPNNWESKVSPDGRYLASRGKNYTTDGFDSLAITDRETGQRTVIKTVKRPLIASIWLWSRDGTRVLLAIERNTGSDTWVTQGFVIAEVGQTTAKVVRNRDTTVRQSYYGWSGDGEGTVAVATNGDTRTLKFYNTEGTEQRSISGVGTLPDTMDFFSPSGERFVADCVGGDGSQHCLWDVATGAVAERFTSDCNKVLGWYDETHLFCWEVDGGNDQVVVVDFEGKIVRTLLEVPDGLQFSVAFTRKPNGAS